MTALQAIESAEKNWQAPEVPEDIPQGDMPGDKIWIGPQQKAKAQALFPALLPLLRKALAKNPAGKAVVALCGGSGVGKTGISALLAYYLNQLGVGCYTHSGDNYPRRIPEQNDAERMRIFRTAGVMGMLRAGSYSPETAAALKNLQEKGLDPDPAQAASAPWLREYQSAGREALAGYLGTELELNYDELSALLGRFKAGEEQVWLRRLGSTDTELWYDQMDMRNVPVLILEWTHSNSPLLENVDIPILLNSTPAETREYRLARGRNANADTPFITMVLEIEQQKQEANAGRAKLIVSKSGELLSFADFQAQMDANR